MNSRSIRQRAPSRTKCSLPNLPAQADVVFQRGNSFPLAALPFLFSVFCFLFSLSGCVNPIPPKALKQQAAEKKEPAPIPARIDGKVWHITWNSRNTAKTGAKSLPVLTADAQTGEFTSDTDPPAIGLNTVQAQIYQDGRHIANLTAARIDANRGDETIHGSGGVTIYSLVNPPDTTITADARCNGKRTAAA